MAFPTVESVTESANLSGVSHSISLPATVNANDLLILIHATQSPETYTNQNAGWTRLYEVGLSTTGMGRVYVKKADGSEDGGTVTLDNDASTDRAGSAHVYRISGWSENLNPGTSGVDHTASSSSLTSSPNPPSETAPWGSDDNLWIALGHASDDDASWDSAPTNYTNLTSTLSGGGTNQSASVGSARRTNETATEDPDTFSLSQSEAVVATTLVVEPAAPGGGGLSIPVAAHHYRQQG